MKLSTVAIGIGMAIAVVASVSFYPSNSSNAPIQTSSAAKGVDNSNLANTETKANLQSTNIPGTDTPYDPEAFVKPSDDQLKNILSEIEYKVTQHEGTERAFSNPMHEEKRAGLYVDIVSGEPLFSSVNKYDSRTGWPSFDRPISESAVVEKSDLSIFGARTEIRSSLADSHLGHVFGDGPSTTGNRYCMNAAAMRFIPLEQMAKAGYGAYIEKVTNK